MSKHSIKFTQPTMTKQSHKQECDINVIMGKYQKTGVINHLKNYGPEYGEYSAIDFQEAMQLIASGKSMFEELPSQARKYFNNDPSEFMRAFQNGGNEETFRELGLLGPKPVPENQDEQNTTTTDSTSESSAEPTQ